MDPLDSLQPDWSDEPHPPSEAEWDLWRLRQAWRKIVDVAVAQGANFRLLRDTAPQELDRQPDGSYSLVVGFPCLAQLGHWLTAGVLTARLLQAAVWSVTGLRVWIVCEPR